MSKIRKMLDSGRILVMGILNVTPDSFFDGGKYDSVEKALRGAEQMIEDGADIIDVGGESSRPGAEPVSENQEIKRIAPVLREMSHFGRQIPVSIDTYKSAVAQQALDMGAAMVNDISGLSGDPDMASTVANAGVPVIIMHMKGTPKSMQKKPQYTDVVSDLIEFFRARSEEARAEGIDRKNIIIDPGIGFGKTTEHNLRIIKNLADFKQLGYKIAVGVSRKSFIGKILGGEADIQNSSPAKLAQRGGEEKPLPPAERLEGSLAAAVICALNGGNILRVHDVKETKRAIKIIEAVYQSK